VKTLEISRATAPLADYVRRASKAPVILTVGGRPVAALVSIKKADLEAVALGTHPDFLALIERSRARQRAEGGISTEDARRRLGLRAKRPAARHGG
jgi:prevent-host-death family protein